MTSEQDRASPPPAPASPDHSPEEMAKAAIEIQRHYRGHRERRQLKGHGLTPTQRWNDALDEAGYRRAARPISRGERIELNKQREEKEKENAALDHGSRVSGSKEMWDKAVLFARRAQHDDPDDTVSETSDEGLSIKSRDSEATKKRKKEEKKEKKKHKRLERIEYSKAMDMQYFLEMVDLKHRYGSNLRAYHSYWQQQDTKENFFYWLDHGEGKEVDLSVCPREQLEKECVRYLSREERRAYLVKIDKNGRLCWANNGKRIDTSTKYKDTPHGIVPVDSEEASEQSADNHGARRRSGSSSSSSSSWSSSSSSGSDQSTIAARYTDPGTAAHHGPKKIFHISASTVLNRLLRKTTKKNTWIFVADNSFRLYVGIKQTGTFQHSSFLHGGRISAAGLIRIRDGQLRSLSPLSGHYRPPAANFRKFVHTLKEAGADTSRVSISKSYAVLLGLEAYANFTKGGNKSKEAAQQIAGKEKQVGKTAITAGVDVCKNAVKSEAERPKEKKKGGRFWGYMKRRKTPLYE